MSILSFNLIDCNISLARPLTFSDSHGAGPKGLRVYYNVHQLTSQEGNEGRKSKWFGKNGHWLGSKLDSQQGCVLL